MLIHFYKYQGTGNDFVMIDNRNQQIQHNQTKLIKQLCDRKFGVGADGCILIENHSKYDFEMVYFNADGNIGSMCGNGGRCTIAFAKQLDIIEEACNFLAYDGVHKGKIENKGIVSLSMANVQNIKKGENYFLLDTGSPHYISFVNNLAQLDVKKEGAKIRNNTQFKKEGVNVNFIEIKENKLAVRTFERGVEDETLSCGTGVVASAISFILKQNIEAQNVVEINTRGGNLEVFLKRNQNDSFSEIWLKGPTENVFEGNIEI